MLLISSLIILAAFNFQNILGVKKPICDLEVSDCLTKAARRSYGDIVNGGVGDTPSSDPLFAHFIEANLPSLSFKLYNVTFSGLKSCNVELVRFNKGSKILDYNILCKRISLEGIYKIKGNIASYFLDGEGDFNSYSYDYSFMLTNEYELYPDKDEKIHIKIKNFEVKFEARGKVVFGGFKNLYNGDKEKSAAILNFANENWQLVDPLVRDPPMKHFMTLFINNFNTYLKAVAMEDIFSQE